MEEMIANLIVALLASFVGTLISLFIIPEWILYLLFIVLVMVAVVIIFVLQAITKKFNVSLATRSKLLTEVSSNELSRLRECLKELEREKSKPKRLPAVFGRLIDDSLQQLIDLTLRDFVGAWNTEQGFGSSNQFVQDVKEDLWKIVQNLQERLAKIDLAKLLCVDFINRFLNHFEQIRLVKSTTSPNKQPAYNLLPHLSSIDSEKDYLRQITSALLVLFFPSSYSSAEPVKHLLREILTCKVLYPTIEAVTDPDFINVKILAYMELHHPRTAHLANNSYERPESIEDFMKTIRNSNDIEVLKQIRYDIVSDIMAATNLQNLNSSQGIDPTPSALVIGGSKVAQSNQTKHIADYLAAKSLCEKRLLVLGWKGYPDEELEEAVEASSIVEKEPLPLLMVLNNAKGRLFLSEYLKQNESPDLIGFWTSVEQLRLSNRCNWHDLGAEIFYTYIHTPLAAIKTDKAMVKRMEAFLLGDNGPEVFYEQQDAILPALEKFYSSFLLTDLYPKMLTALESPEFEEGDLGDDRLAEAREQLPSEEMEDKSNYSRRKLAELQERLKNKEQALQALRTSLKPESRVLAQLEAEVEGLKGEMRQMEAHVMRTDAWGEHLGQWRVVVQNAEMSEDKEWPQFVLVVHILEDDRDSDSISTGWVVLRKLHHFHDLHRKLCQLNSDVKQLELPSQLKFRLGKSTVKNALEKAKIQTQKFLQFVLEDERLNQCEALYTFLSPSSDHLKQSEPAQKKPKFSLSAMFKSGGWDASIFRYPSPKEPIEEDISLLVDDTEGLKTLGESTDAIAEPLYSLLNELCDLNTTFKWIRRTLITTVQLTYNRTINRAVRVIIADLFSEQNVYGYIQIFIKSWWPNGQFNQTLPHRTADEKQHTRQEVREHFLGNIPLILSNLVGHQNARLGATKVYDALQDPLLNKQILYICCDDLGHIFKPAMTSSEDVLLQVGQVRYKKGDGTLYVMNERLAWMMDHRDTVSVSHRYTDIKMQKISPEGKPKIQLQVVLHDGSASTFQFVNKVGHENQIKERDDVKQLLQQLLVKFKSEVNKELEEKNRMLSENPAMLQLYRDLVTTQVISSEEFWAHHTSKFFKQQQLAPKQDIGVTGAFLADIKPQTDGCNGLKYNLTTDIIECIFKTYPAVRKKHLDQVPHKVLEGDFWTKFFQSHYFHRDRINTGTKDLFTECAKLDDLELKNDINAGIDDLLVDLVSFDDKSLDEGYGTALEKGSSSGGNQVHQSMIKRFNQHSIMVLKACKKGAENGEPSVLLPNENSALSLNNVPNAAGVGSMKRGVGSGSMSLISSGSNSPQPDIEQNGKSEFHQTKKLRIQEKICFEDLKSPVENESDSARLNLFKVDRYLHGPLLEAGSQDSVRDDLDCESQMFEVNDEAISWNGRKNVSRGAAYVSPASAVGALGELTPGGALMKGFREESLAHMVHKETQRELKNLYLSSCELLRHFWASFPPTTPALEAKAVRMHEALHRFHSARLKPFEDRLSREFSPLSKQLTSHLNQMLNYAYRKFATWQQRQHVR